MQEAVWLNDQTYLDYKHRLKKIATSIFEWKNLPDSMDSEYIEYCLYALGQCAFLKTEEYGFINTKATINGNLNLYGLPTALNCYSYGSVQYNRNVYYGGDSGDENTECILVKNTQDRNPVPTVTTLELFAYRLYQAERTADVNIQNAKRSRLILTTENQRLTMENVFRQYDSNVPYIFGDTENFKKGSVDSLDISSAFIGSDIMKYKKEIWNEALTFLGVDNFSEKKERLVTEEVGTNNEVINLNLMSFLAPRQKACELFNKKYGENIEVKVRSDLDNIIKTYASSIADDYKEQIMQDEVKEMTEGVVK
jgi:hypothetical protein